MLPSNVHGVEYCWYFTMTVGLGAVAGIKLSLRYRALRYICRCLMAELSLDVGVHIQLTMPSGFGADASLSVSLHVRSRWGWLSRCRWRAAGRGNVSSAPVSFFGWNLSFSLVEQTR